MGENLHDLGYDNDYVDIKPKVQSMQEIFDKLDFLKIKHFCFGKDKAKRMRIQATDW